MIARRALLAALAAPSLAHAQARPYRIGSLHLAGWDTPQHIAFRAALARAGLSDGQGVFLDPEGYGLPREQFEAHAQAMVRQGIDAFCVTGEPAVRAALAASRSLPILAIADDPVAAGLAASYAQPGGTVTGVSILGGLLDQKRLSILVDMLPAARRVAALGDALVTTPAQAAAQVATAASRGVTLEVTLIQRPDEIAPTLARLRQAGAEAVNVLATPLFNVYRGVVIEQMARLGLPAIYQWPDMAREGGLVGYGPDLVQLFRDQMAPLLLRLLRGASPATLPIEQPSRFSLVVNQRTATGLGLALSPALLAQADEVIE